MKIRDGADEPKCAADVERILDWSRLLACHIGQNEAGIEKYREILKTRGETERRLREFNNWRESMAFTEREKAILSLIESMSSRQSEKLSLGALRDAKRHFNRTEII